MSAFVVSQNHIRALITFAQRQGMTFYIGTPCKTFCAVRQPEAIGQILHDANVQSVNYRYGDAALPMSFEFRPYLTHASPVKILAACSCYDYQACEVPNYRQTEASEIIDALRQEGIRMLTGYKSSGWEIV